MTTHRLALFLALEDALTVTEAQSEPSRTFEDGGTGNLQHAQSSGVAPSMAVNQEILQESKHFQDNENSDVDSVISDNPVYVVESMPISTSRNHPIRHTAVSSFGQAFAESVTKRESCDDLSVSKTSTEARPSIEKLRIDIGDIDAELRNERQALALLRNSYTVNVARLGRLEKDLSAHSQQWEAEETARVSNEINASESKKRKRDSTTGDPSHEGKHRKLTSGIASAATFLAGLGLGVAILKPLQAYMSNVPSA